MSMQARKVVPSGFEPCYDVALTSWLRLAGDVQWVVPARALQDDAVVAGTIVNLLF